jgi:hypothetical protein
VAEKVPCGLALGAVIVGNGSDLRRAGQRHPQTVPQRSQQLLVALCIAQSSFVRRRHPQRRVIGVDGLLARSAAACAARGETAAYDQ